MSAEEDHGALSQFAEWLGLEGEEAAEFLKVGMTRKGHKPVMSWADGDGKKEDKGGTVMGIRSGGQKKAAGSGWQYGG